mgnify:CR=1 FL=1
MNKGHPILCLDFDGVIHSYTSGWQGAGICADPPVEGTAEFLREAITRFRIAIYSSRSKSLAGRRAMKRYMREHFNTPADPVFSRMWINHPEDHDLPIERPKMLWEVIEWPWFKPSAFLTIDDRALTFNGSWDIFNPDVLREFKPWNKP